MLLKNKIGELPPRFRWDNHHTGDFSYCQVITRTARVIHRPMRNRSLILPSLPLLRVPDSVQSDWHLPLQARRRSPHIDDFPLHHVIVHLDIHATFWTVSHALPPCSPSYKIGRSDVRETFKNVGIYITIYSPNRIERFDFRFNWVHRNFSGGLNSKFKFLKSLNF